ncbi:MAG TPA: FAD-dependent oxidoreductase [Anaerolineales bacterium]|nr:FAD-dependent oxidoreductase [Anaerolineales bacterium]
MTPQTTIIVGAGIFGVTAALELKRRGHRVHLLDPGPLPHPLAESTDISKAVRMDYGPDEDYMAWMETALDAWRAWNKSWPAPLFHEVGVTFLRRGLMTEDDFEYESYRLLLKRGHQPLRMDSNEIRRRFPAWSADRYVDGYFNPEGGYAQSGRVVAELLKRARAEGVELHERQTFDHFLDSGSRVRGIVTREGIEYQGDQVIIAAGAWVPYIIPPLADVFRANGMPVFHLKPDRPELFRAGQFPVFGADISATGYYGFPLHPTEGVVKIANHGPGRQLDPSSERAVTDEETVQLRDFLADTFPTLADAPIVYTRVCIYCDTWDGHLWIAPDPECEGVVVATGGSGHAFKFAPVLGQVIADAVEGAPNPRLEKFRWRPEIRPPKTAEAARYQES